MTKVANAPGLADHDNIIIDLEMRPHHLKAAPRKVFSYGKANLDKLVSGIDKFSTNILENSPETNSVEHNWSNFKGSLLKLLEKHVPSRLAKTPP